MPSDKRSLRPIGLRFCDVHHFRGSARSHCSDAGGRQSLASTAWQSRSAGGSDAVTCNAGSPFRCSCRYRCNPSPDSRLAFRSAPMLILESAGEAVCDRCHSMGFLIAASPKSTIYTANRVTALSFQLTPLPAAFSTMATPCSTRRGWSRMGFHHSAYSR